MARLVNFEDLGDAKQNDSTKNTGECSEARITRSLSASTAAQSGGRGKPELRIADEVVGQESESSDHQSLQRITRRRSKSLSYLDINSGNNMQQGSDVSKRCVGVLEETRSPIILGQENSSLSRITKSSIGVKRKRKEMDEGDQEIDHGWTKEQERALQKAYFAAKPTPSFWKKVAKLVGKSAQECFNKINSENPTPPLPHPRSRVKGKNLSAEFAVSFSETDLLSEKKRKSKGRNAHKSRITQRIVRHLMRKQCEQDNNADLFSILEPNVSLSAQALPSSPVLSTPMSITERGSSSSYSSRSLSSRKKSNSRFSGKSGIASPLILKPIENMALHDKYIDQLRAREAKRTAACNRRLAHSQADRSDPCLKNKDVVKAAKESLMSDARNAIKKFRDSEAYIESCCDSEEECDDEEDDNDIVL